MFDLRRKDPLNKPMHQRSRRRRVEGKRAQLQNWAEEENISITALLGYFVYVENYHGGDRCLATIGWKMFMGEDVSSIPKVSVEEAIWLIEKSGMSQAVYLEIRLRLKDRIYFPPVMQIRAENKSHRPELQEYMHGVKAPLIQCISLTLSERLTHMDLTGIEMNNMEIKFKFGWGLDGSGEHSNYHQLSKVHFSTNQVMSVCLSIREVNVCDDTGMSVSWNNKASGANKPQNTRPLAIFPAKENVELLKEFVPIVEAEIKSIIEDGVPMNVYGRDIKAVCEQCSMSMIDGKMVTNLLN